MGPSSHEIAEQTPWEGRGEESPGHQDVFASSDVFGVCRPVQRDS